MTINVPGLRALTCGDDKKGNSSKVFLVNFMFFRLSGFMIFFSFFFLRK